MATCDTYGRGLRPLIYIYNIVVQGQALSAQSYFLQGQAHQKKDWSVEFNCITG